MLQGHVLVKYIISLQEFQEAALKHEVSVEQHRTDFYIITSGADLTNRPGKRPDPVDDLQRAVLTETNHLEWPGRCKLSGLTLYMCLRSTKPVLSRRAIFVWPLRAPGEPRPPVWYSRNMLGKCTRMYLCYGEHQIFTHHSKRRGFVRCGVLQACESSHHNNV